MRVATKLQSLHMEDVQARPDHRGVVIDQVGIEGLSYPIRVVGPNGEQQATISQVGMTVELSESIRGVHMSRFVEVLHQFADGVDGESVQQMTIESAARLQSDFARIELQFPFFLPRTAPESGLESLMEYRCTLIGETRDGQTALTLGVNVPITSLCPCSKEISDYGAHNQRGFVEIEARSPWPSGEASGIWLDELIEVAESAGSAPVYPLLKRSDERELTMRAYDNPVFVEDVVRNVAVALREDLRVASFWTKAANQESIHNHTASAQLRWERRGQGG